MFSALVQLRAVAAIAFIVICVPAANGAAAEPSSSEKHCLWRVTNARAPFYLLGSIHVLRSADYPLAPIVEEAIDHSQRFLFETDPREDEKLANLFVNAAYYPTGTNLRQKVNPKTYDYLNKISKVPPTSWVHLRPWAIAISLLSHPGFEKVSAAWGLDNYVERKAVKHPHEFGGLESAVDHMKVFSDMLDIESEVFLLQALVYAGREARHFQLDVAAWKTGDVQHIYSMELGRIKEAPTIYWRLLDRRNAKWIPRIEAAIKSGKPTMVVAGVLHFGGPHSVIAMLKARGYKIEQL